MNRAQFKEMWWAQDTGDIEKFGTFIDDEVVFNMVGVPGQETHFTGKKALKEFFQGVANLKSRGESYFHLEPEWIVIEGDLAAAHGTGKHTYPGRLGDTVRFVDFFKMKDGKIVEYNVFIYSVE
ncbi:nuclear transport factor 2 family protein [Chloroflexota bacterium]